MKKRSLPLVKLPSSVDLSLFLIREELKSTRFFNHLADLGFSDCFYQPHLSSAILAEIGFGEVPDEFFALYCDLIDQHSREITEDLTNVTAHALEIYHALIREKDKEDPAGPFTRHRHDLT